MDETILENVYLVGTTSRTATFLQVSDWGVRSSIKPSQAQECTPVAVEERENSDVTQEKMLGESARFNKLSIATHADTNACPLGPKVLVMDRALIVCHAKGDLCKNQKRRSRVASRSAPERNGNGLGTSLKSLENGVGALNEQIDLMPGRKEWQELRAGVDDHLNQHVQEVDLHLNRHLDHVKGRIGKLEADLQDTLKGLRIEGT